MPYSAKAQRMKEQEGKRLVDLCSHVQICLFTDAPSFVEGAFLFGVKGVMKMDGDPRSYRCENDDASQHLHCVIIMYPLVHSKNRQSIFITSCGGMDS
ncbi:hypothetical protein GCM10010965_28160 [Caldalkalibacillus thermarum]|nr:hypothetical protein GCM10010965_28160 [Caldalkalibacillus thermarum]